ncbi:MAG: nicotinamide mononucleotide transporter [Clostridia bacterium]|nr:nicotinamide mononucleotide transporter [Clostridia bacterium]
MKMGNKKKAILFEYLPMAVTGIIILVCAIVFKQMFIKVLPLFFSLLIMLLNSRANRIGFLLGAINSCIYIIGYLMEGVYGTVASTVFGIVIMLITYFRWKRNAYGKATVFRRFSARGRVLLTLALCVVWAATSFVLSKIGGTATVIDGLTMVLGFATNILTIVAYVEAPFLNIISGLCQFALWVQIVFINGNYAAITYLVYNVYCTYMIVRTFVRWRKLYKEQRC